MIFGSNKPRRKISPDSARKKIKDKRRVQLLEANMASIAKRGLSETTITHVSEAAGMSRGIVNFYFDSKEMMMRETLSHLMKENTESWEEALDKAKGQPAAAQLGIIINALFSAKICNRKRLSVWAAFAAHAATHAEYRAIIQEEANTLHSTLTRLASLADKLVDAKAFATGFINFMNGLWMDLLLGESNRGRDDLVRDALSFTEMSCGISPTRLEAGLRSTSNGRSSAISSEERIAKVS